MSAFRAFEAATTTIIGAPRHHKCTNDRGDHQITKPRSLEYRDRPTPILVIFAKQTQFRNVI